MSYLSEEEMKKRENFEHEVLDRLYCLAEDDFDKNKVDDSYIDAALKARNIILDVYKKEKEKTYNLAKAIKYMGTNPDITEAEIIEMFEKNPVTQEQIEKMNKNYISKDKIEKEFEKFTAHNNCFNLGDMQLLLDNIIMEE